VSRDIWENKESKITLNWKTLALILLTCRIWWAPNNASKWQMGFNSAFEGLNEKDEMEYTLRLELVRQDCICGRGCCWSRSVKVQYDINFATSVNAVKEQTLACTQCYCDVRVGLLKMNCDKIILRVDIKYRVYWVPANIIYLSLIFTAGSYVFPWWLILKLFLYLVFLAQHRMVFLYFCSLHTALIWKCFFRIL